LHAPDIRIILCACEQKPQDVAFSNFDRVNKFSMCCPSVAENITAQSAPEWPAEAAAESLTTFRPAADHRT
jgi:hypothetical protein